MALIPSRSNDHWGLDATSNPASLGSDLNRLFDNLASSMRQTPGAARFPLDMYESDNHLNVDMAIPGVRAEDLDVQVEGTSLYIRGKYPTLAENEQRYWVKTMPHGEFQYTLALPVKVEAEQVDASVKDGVLHLKLPKVAEARTRKIEIKRIA